VPCWEDIARQSCAMVPRWRFLATFVLSSVFLPHTTTSLYDSLNLVIKAFSSGLLGVMVQEKKVERAAAFTGLCCMHNACASMRCLPERKNVIYMMCLI